MSSLPFDVAPGPTSQQTPPLPVDAVRPTPPENDTDPVGGSSNSSLLVALGVGIGIGGAIVLVCVGIFVIWYKRRTRRRFGKNEFAYAPSQTQGSKDDPFSVPQQNLQRPYPPPTGNAFAPLKPTPSLATSSHSRTSSREGFVPVPPFFGSGGNPTVNIPHSMADANMSFTKTVFTFEELEHATDNFSDENLLGQGGFGYVHKGVLSDGREVAIKQLKVGSGQGEREFHAEVETISRVHHKHLVSLVGHCISETQMLLVYEFVPNQTLEFHLHGKDKPPISWATRMKIALGSARGLRYLHEDCRPKIIHRDIKSANILVDENFEAKVADFGLARFHSDADTHVSTRVMGTFGYLAPEYALTGKLTDKSDVFSFGVVLLELITGRRPIDKSQHYLDDNIIDWARPLLAQALGNGDFDGLTDPRLQKDYDLVQMARMVACASACVRHLARRRPRMSQVLNALEGNTPLDELNDGLQPIHRSVHTSSPGSAELDLSYDTMQYKEDLIKFRKMALQSMDVTTSECSGPTSEFGALPSGSSGEGMQKPR